MKRLLIFAQVVAPKTNQDQIVQHSTPDVLAPIEAQSSLRQRVLLSVVSFVVAIALLFLGMHASANQDPYISSVLQLTGDADRGKEIFILNCATCHGLEANGEVGPDLRNVSERKSRAALIEQVISGQTPPMPQFQPSERDMADLLSFLETL